MLLRRADPCDCCFLFSRSGAAYVVMMHQLLVNLHLPVTVCYSPVCWWTVTTLPSENHSQLTTSDSFFLLFFFALMTNCWVSNCPPPQTWPYTLQFILPLKHDPLSNIAQFQSIFPGRLLVHSACVLYIWVFTTAPSPLVTVLIPQC